MDTQLEMKILKEKRGDLVRSMDKANEERNFAEFNKLEIDLRQIDSKILKLENELKNITSEINKKYTESSLIKGIELSEREFKELFTHREERGSHSFGDYARGILFNDWNGTDEIRKVDGSVVVPTQIISDIVYAALKKSVLLGNCPVLPMTSSKAIIGKVKENVTLDFKKPYEKAHETNLLLEGVELSAKTLYGYVTISEEDVEDVENLEGILRKALSDCVAQTLDENFLYNSEKVTTTNKDIYPTGILDLENIKKIAINKLDYDEISKAMLEIETENGTPNTLALHTSRNHELRTVKNSLGDYVVAPRFMDNLKTISSNSIKSNDVIVFDSNQIVIGIRKKMELKMMPDLTNGTVLLRVMMRADVATTNENTVCKMTIGN